MVTMADDCIGRVVQALKAKGIWDDALVIFMLDHGEMLGSHALMQKHCCYEEAAHVALMIKPPGGKKSGRRDHLVGHIDFANTICDYAGVAPLRESPGHSLRPIIEDAAAPWRDVTFMEYNGDWGRSTPMRAVVADIDGQTFKYIYHVEDHDELYNLSNDPFEKTSLAEHAGHQMIRSQLRQRVARWMTNTGDFLHIPGRHDGLS
jgi:arylsulfatase A-like enzyme